jgi:SAM-dependent methyltransferase
MVRNVAVTLFDTSKIYEVQPDAIVCELESLEEWQALVAQFALHDPARSEAIAKRARRDGVDSIHFGHVAAPAVRHDTANGHWDIDVQGVRNCERAVLELLAVSRFGHPTARVYAAEAMSAFARALRLKYPEFLGSQYAPNAETQRRISPIPHQDLTQLSLPDASFDVVASVEVLEHIPYLSRALSEMARVLAPGGLMFSTFPFLWNSRRTEWRAELVNGQIRHLVEKAEYHGDPMNPDGVLVFQLPGWDIVKMAKDAGFKTAKLVFYSSALGGIIGVHLIGRFVFVCER